jgi:hypothetical protein
LVQLRLPVAVGLAGSFLIGLHAGLRFPRCPGLLVVSPGGRFALPAQGLFGLTLAPATRVGGAWVELAFEHERVPPLLLLRDQFTDSAWRRLRIALAEWI